MKKLIFAGLFSVSLLVAGCWVHTPPPKGPAPAGDPDDGKAPPPKGDPDDGKTPPPAGDPDDGKAPPPAAGDPDDGKAPPPKGDPDDGKAPPPKGDPDDGKAPPPKGDPDGRTTHRAPPAARGLEVKVTSTNVRAGGQVEIVLVPHRKNIKIFFGGRVLPKRTRGTSFIVTIPGNAKSGHIEVEWNGHPYKSPFIKVRR